MGLIIETKVLLALANEDKEIYSHVAKIHQAFVDLTNKDAEDLLKIFLKGILKEDTLQGQVKIVGVGTQKILVQARFPTVEGSVDFFLIIPRYDLINSEEETNKSLLLKINAKMDEIYDNKDNPDYNMPIMYPTLQAAQKAFDNVDKDIESLKTYNIYTSLIGYFRLLKISMKRDDIPTDEEMSIILKTWQWDNETVQEYREIMTGLIYSWTKNMKYSKQKLMNIIYKQAAGLAIAYIIKNSNIEEILNA